MKQIVCVPNPLLLEQAKAKFPNAIYLDAKTWSEWFCMNESEGSDFIKNYKID